MIQIILNIITFILFLIFIILNVKTIKYYESKIGNVKTIVNVLKSEQYFKLSNKRKYINRKRIIAMCEDIERIIDYE